jgi:glucosyl-dolichyl phosphate glucuronosyltransferase
MDISPENRSPRITVAICTWNRAAYLRKAIQSVLDQIPKDMELLIVDNASTDATPAILAEFAKFHPHIVLYREPRIGVSHARNTVMEHAKGDVVLFLDDDGWAEAGWLKAYQQFLINRPLERLGCVGGPIRAFFDSPRPRWLASNFYELDKGPEICKLVESDAPWGGNVAYNKRAVQQVGGFAVDLGRKGGFLGAHEESELNRRLKTEGFDNWWLPTASIQHLVPANRLRLSWQVHSAFSYGRSSAVVRMKAVKSRVAQVLYAIGRVLFAPVDCLLNLLVSLCTWPFAGGRLAVKALGRSARVAGMTYQLSRQIIGR